jgi:hypothetical protein
VLFFQTPLLCIEPENKKNEKMGEGAWYTSLDAMPKGRRRKKKAESW